MRLRDQLRPELKRLSARQSQEATSVITATSDVGRLECHLEQIDSIASALQRLSFAAEQPLSASPAELLQVGTALAARLTYLLEPIRVHEHDPDAGAVLLRSIPPHREDRTASYYELSVTSEGIHLRRYEKQPRGERRPALMHVTHEVLCRCAEDLESTIRDQSQPRRRP